MDGLTFYKLIHILKEKLINSKLNTLTIDKDSVFLSFYAGGIFNLEYRALNDTAPSYFKRVYFLLAFGRLYLPPAPIFLSASTAKKYQEILDEAELIKNNLYKVQAAGKYIFEKYSKDGICEVEYNVEHGDNLQKKSEKLFKKAFRLKKSVSLIEERLQDTMQLALFSEEQIFYAETLSEEELSEFEKILDDESKCIFRLCNIFFISIVNINKAFTAVF